MKKYVCLAVLLLYFVLPVRAEIIHLTNNDLNDQYPVLDVINGVPHVYWMSGCTNSACAKLNYYNGNEIIVLIDGEVGTEIQVYTPLRERIVNLSRTTPLAKEGFFVFESPVQGKSGLEIFLYVPDTTEINLSKFEAVPSDRKVEVKWKTESEM